ncbi:MAG: hypothetical protein AAF242_18245, partial [Bacteroidota bacterium]
MRQFLFIFSAMLLGIVFYQGYQITWVVRYAVMVMLFLAFIQIDFNWKVLHRKHLLVAIANILLPTIVFFLLKPWNYEVALACFVIMLAPTAAGAPIMASFLKTKVEFVTASVLITTPLIAIILPILLPQIAQVEGEMRVMDVLRPTFILVFGPLILSQFLKYFAKPLVPYFISINWLSFYLFIFNIYIAAGKASYFIRFESGAAWTTLVFTGLAVGVCCFLLFKIGEHLIGRKTLRWESGLALGRKNTMFSLWVALSFLGPMVALGPIFYILFHNLYNGWQFMQLNKK